MGAVSISHPAAPAAATVLGKVPKYLIRKDGVVLHYNAVLARMGGFQPADELPEWYVSRVAAAMQREAERHAARAEAQKGAAQVRIENAQRADGHTHAPRPMAPAASPRRRPRPGVR